MNHLSLIDKERHFLNRNYEISILRNANPLIDFMNSFQLAVGCKEWMNGQGKNMDFWMGRQGKNTSKKTSYEFSDGISFIHSGQGVLSLTFLVWWQKDNGVLYLLKIPKAVYHSELGWKWLGPWVASYFILASGPLMKLVRYSRHIKSYVHEIPWPGQNLPKVTTHYLKPSLFSSWRSDTAALSNEVAFCHRFEPVDDVHRPSSKWFDWNQDFLHSILNGIHLKGYGFASLRNKIKSHFQWSHITDQSELHVEWQYTNRGTEAIPVFAFLRSLLDPT
jgi:hypothetical protein